MNTFKTTISVLRELSLTDIREDAERIPHVLVFGPTQFDARWLADGLFGERESDTIVTRELTGAITDIERYDAVVVFDPHGDAEALGLNAGLRALRTAPPIFRIGGVDPVDDTRLDELRMEMVRRLDNRAIAFARVFPKLRASASKNEIDQAAIANAQFALVTNIPSLIPVIGGFASAGADMIVLTKNQAIMVYKLAAIHGRDLHNQIEIFQEITPIIGAGFVWRSAARAATTMLPFAAGTIPKVGIAYAATMSMGRAAEFYYRTEMRPTKEQLSGYLRQGIDTVKQLPIAKLARRNRPGNELDG